MPSPPRDSFTPMSCCVALTEEQCRLLAALAGGPFRAEALDSRVSLAEFRRGAGSSARRG